jgi:hypothetical protein
VSLLISKHFEISAAIGWATIPFQIWKLQHNPHKALFAALLLALIGLKKLIDLPRERRVRQANGG